MNDQFALFGAETKEVEAKVMWESLAKNNERTLTSYISLLNTSGLDAWQNGRVKEVTSASDFDFADIRKSPHSIYLTINTHDIAPNAGLIRLFFGDLIANLERHEPGLDEPWPVMIILDEFHKLGKMPIVAESITTLQSYGARLAIITQTIPKLDEIYGENERRSLEGGAGIKVFMTPSEELTIGALSEACCMTTKRSVTKSRQAGFLQKTNISERTEEVPLLKEDDARRLDMSDIILVVDGDHPIRAKGIRYYEDKTLQPIFDAYASKPLPGSDARGKKVAVLNVSHTGSLFALADRVSDRGFNSPVQHAGYLL
jgi:type IV secretion system protein VirD4